MGYSHHSWEEQKEYKYEVPEGGYYPQKGYLKIRLTIGNVSKYLPNLNFSGGSGPYYTLPDKPIYYYCPIVGKKSLDIDVEGIIEAANKIDHLILYINDVLGDCRDTKGFAGDAVSTDLGPLLGPQLDDIDEFLNPAISKLEKLKKEIIDDAKSYYNKATYLSKIIDDSGNTIEIQ